MIIPNQLTLAEVQRSLREVQQILKPFENVNVDFHGRRITNAGRAIADFDYITKFDAEDLVQKAITDLQTDTPDTLVGPLNAAGPIRFGLFTTRGAPISRSGELFIATDHNYVGWLSTGTAWIPVFGRNRATQSGISAISAMLTSNDANYRLEVTDFVHVLRWSGSAWAFAPEDDGSNYYRMADEAPTNGLWQACDGSTVSYLKADGTTGSKSLDDLSTSAYLKGGTTAAAVAAASGFTDDDPTTRHTHTFTTGAPSATTTVDNTLGGSTVAVASGTHTHTGTTDPGTAHHHGPGDLELRRKQVILYFRR